MENTKKTIDDVKFDPTGDYVTQLTELIDAIFDDLKLIDLDNRLSLVDLIIENYVTDVGYRPKGVALSRLGHALSWDFMEGDRNPFKIAHNEYPVLTDSQLSYRQTGNGRSRKHQKTFNYEVPLYEAQYNATNGFNYSLPIRRYD